MLHKEAPGLVIAMISGSLAVTPHAMLSRSVHKSQSIGSGTCACMYACMYDVCMTYCMYACINNTPVRL